MPTATKAVQGVTREQLEALRVPFAMSSVKWKPQGKPFQRRGKDEWAVMCVPYVDARMMQARLDSVLGPENWQVMYSELGQDLFATLSILTANGWVVKQDAGFVGQSDQARESGGDFGSKGSVSDAFKRAAVAWGIGRYLYALPKLWLTCELNQAGKFRKLLQTPDYRDFPWWGVHPEEVGEWEHATGKVAPRSAPLEEQAGAGEGSEDGESPEEEQAPEKAKPAPAPAPVQVPPGQRVPAPVEGAAACAASCASCGGPVVAYLDSKGVQHSANALFDEALEDAGEAAPRILCGRCRYETARSSEAALTKNSFWTWVWGVYCPDDMRGNADAKQKIKALADQAVEKAGGDYKAAQVLLQKQGNVLMVKV